MKPRSATEIIDAGMQLYRNHFALFFGIAAITQVPASLLQIVFFRIFAGTWGMPTGEAITRDLPLFIKSVIFYMPVAFVAYAVVQASLVYATSEAYLGRVGGVKDAVRAAAPRIVSAAVTSLLCGIMIGAGFVFFLIPGVILSLWWALTTQIVVLEKVGPAGALTRSKALTEGRRGQIGTLLFLITVVAGIISLGLNGVLSLAIKDMPLVLALAQIFPVVLLAPLNASFMTLAYFDLRIRKEGFDLEVASGDLGDGSSVGRAPSPPSPPSPPLLG